MLNLSVISRQFLDWLLRLFSFLMSFIIWLRFKSPLQALSASQFLNSKGFLGAIPKMSLHKAPEFLQVFEQWAWQLEHWCDAPQRLSCNQPWFSRTFSVFALITGDWGTFATSNPACFHLILFYSCNDTRIIFLRLALFFFNTEFS